MIQFKIFNMTSDEIKQKREDAGLTQKQIAELIGIARPTISALENGKRRITPKIDRALIFFFDRLEQDEKLRQLIVEWETHFTTVLNDKRFKDMDIEMIPSLKKVKIILDKIKVITGL